MAHQRQGLCTVYRIQGDTIAGAHALGAVAGASVIYALTHAGPFAAMHWLSARPALLINDAMAIVSLTLFAWALVRNLDTPLLAGVLLLMTVFHSTARCWCVDYAPQVFSVTVQHALVIQFGLIALSLLTTLRKFPDRSDLG